MNMLTPLFICLGGSALLIYKFVAKPKYKQWLQIGLASLVWTWLILNLYPITAEFGQNRILPREASPLVSLSNQPATVMQPHIVAKNNKVTPSVDYTPVATIAATHRHQSSHQ